MVKNPPSNAGDAGSIPGRGTKISRATGQLSPRTTTREKPAPRKERSHMSQLRSCEPQLRPDAAAPHPKKVRKIVFQGQEQKQLSSEITIKSISPYQFLTSPAS